MRSKVKKKRVASAEQILKIVAKNGGLLKVETRAFMNNPPNFIIRIYTQNGKCYDFVAKESASNIVIYRQLVKSVDVS
ncbi:MAG: hypothetical protein ACFFCW_39035 [Candidatus Hodarchaeota archaeon]